MSKGPSNRYGNSNGANGKGKPTRNINYAWAKYFNKNTLSKHFKEHGRNMNFYSENEYEAHAASFANRVDRKNHVSFIEENGTTAKYSKTTNEFALIKNDGTVITYFKPKEGIKYFNKLMKGKK